MRGRPGNPNWRAALELARQAPRCQAKRRFNRGPCHEPAIKGRRVCRLHGGKGGGPKGKANGAFKTGRYSKETIARRRQSRAAAAALRDLLNMARELD